MVFSSVLFLSSEEPFPHPVNNTHNPMHSNRYLKTLFMVPPILFCLYLTGKNNNTFFIPCPKILRRNVCHIPVSIHTRHTVTAFTKYFIQGWKEKETCIMVLDTVSENRFQGYLWQYQAKSMKDCADAFLSAPIWDGKDFLQIQDSVIWSDW